jgi:hypothetical protein
MEVSEVMGYPSDRIYLKDGDFPMEIPIIQRAWIIGVSQLETTVPPDGFWIS